MIQLSEITKEKDKCEHVWCITCKTKGHKKEECPTFTQYMVTEALDPLVGGVGYCEICKTWGNHSTTFPYCRHIRAPQGILYFNFCKSVRHNEKYCRTFDLMRECTSNDYKIREENVVAKGGIPQYNTPRGFNQGGHGGFNRGLGCGGFGQGGIGPIICYNCNLLGHLTRDC
jgi:hypothetical protein